jgi:hypothetical protein
MKRRRGKSESLRFIAECEQRVARQKQLIEQLKRWGRSTEEAEGTLRQQHEMLATLRNHADIMRDLMSPNAHERKLGTKPAAN